MHRTFSILLIVGVALLMVEMLEASSFQVQGPTDHWEIGETAGATLAAVSSTEIPELASGTLSTQQGKTKYDQYLRFQDTVSSFTGLNVSYTRTGGVVGDFLTGGSINDASRAIFQYELVFQDGFKSEVQSNSLKDFVGKKINIVNEEYLIVRAIRNSNDITLEMTSSGAISLLKEGEKGSFVVNALSHAVEVVAVESGTSKKAKLKVDGKDIQDLSIGDMVTLSDGLVVGVSNILTGGTGQVDMAEVFMGGKIIEFRDSDFTDNSFYQGLSINKKKLSEGFVRISGSVSGAIVTITSIKYRPTMFKTVYISAKGKLSDFLTDKNLMLANWDIRYDGLEKTTISTILLSSDDDQEYKLQFENQDGQSVTIPFVSAKSTFKLGDSGKDLVLVESGAIATSNVDPNDYFILTDTNDKTGKTFVVRFESYSNSTRTLSFTDISSGNSINVQTTNGTGSVDGEGTLSVGSISSKVYVLTTGSLSVDLNGDGDVLDSGTGVNIVTKGGAILELGNTNAISSPYTVTVRTKASQFDEASADETFSFTITGSGKNVGVSSLSGVTMYSSSSNHFMGMTNYGALVDNYDIGGSDAETLTIQYPMKQVFAQVYVDVNQPSITSSEVTKTTDTCANGIQDGDETGLDCGGSCTSCTAGASCSDAIQNQGETGVDCGGPCDPCTLQGTGAPTELVCNGCWYVDPSGIKTCLAVGNLVEELYCASDKTLTPLKANGEPCQQAYECKIGLCEENLCGKRMTPGIVISNVLVVILVLVVLYYILVILKHS